MNSKKWPDPARFWGQRRVCVTGVTGFLGACVVDQLRARGARQVFVPRQANYDLRDRAAILDMLRDARPDLVIHLAASAGGILLAAERYDSPEPVNLGSSHEINIKDLTETIARLTGFTGRIVWDPSQPNGQPRCKLDVSRAELLFGFRSQVAFEEGLRRTIDWYQAVTASSCHGRSNVQMYGV